jgi:hypothetical protein
MPDEILNAPTANQLYKASNTTLTFAEWIEREKQKGVMMKNALLDDINKDITTDEKPEGKKLDIGIPTWALLSGCVILITALIYKRYKK